MFVKKIDPYLGTNLAIPLWVKTLLFSRLDKNDFLIAFELKTIVGSSFCMRIEESLTLFRSITMVLFSKNSILNLRAFFRQNIPFCTLCSSKTKAVTPKFYFIFVMLILWNSFVQSFIKMTSQIHLTGNVLKQCNK